jgi:predicted NBD/HSP70 family sugar kinase
LTIPDYSTFISRRGARGAAVDRIRRHNLSAVLAPLHLTGPMTRSELTAHTGLNRSTVADLVGELTDLGLVTEGPGLTSSGPGRPSPVVEVRPHGAAVLAIELSVDSIAVATLGLGGRVFNRIRIARPRGHVSPEEMVEDAAQLAEPLLDALPPEHGFAGVAAAMVGITRRSDGFVHLAPNLGWREIPLGEMLATALDVGHPITVANEADLGALGEFRRGTQAGVRNLVYVHGEVGIGTGVIVDGKPLLGMLGYAGEAGHMLVNPGGRRCHCGATGCWETEAGEPAVLRHAGVETAETGMGLIDEVVSKAEAGDGQTLDAMNRVGRWLGVGVGDLVNIFNPELVLLGGLFHRLYGYLEESVMAGARSRMLAAPGETVEIARGDLGVDAPLIGAAELVLSEVIADPAAFRNRLTGAGHPSR